MFRKKTLLKTKSFGLRKDLKTTKEKQKRMALEMMKRKNISAKRTTIENATNSD